jgi:hypothetical protein
MSGSIVAVSYARDNGQFYALRRDESNSRATVKSDTTATPVKLYTNPATPFVGSLPPKGFKPRYANTYLKADPRFKKVFVIGSTAALTVCTEIGAEISMIEPSLSASPSIYVVTTVIGERNPRNISFTAPDSGQDDGTPGPSTI